MHAKTFIAMCIIDAINAYIYLDSCLACFRWNVDLIDYYSLCPHKYN
jgi:hypothetical protein